MQPTTYQDTVAQNAITTAAINTATGAGKSVDVSKVTTPSSVPSAIVPNSSNASSAVITNANPIEKYIPTANEKLMNLTNKGVTVGPDGIARYADNTMVPQTGQYNQQGQEIDQTGKVISGGRTFSDVGGETYGSTQATGVASPDDYYNKEMGMLDSMKASLDASTKSLIDNIQQKYAIRKQQMEDINTRQAKGVEQSLLVGASSRYAMQSSQGIISTQERYGIQELATLDAEENDFIQRAKSAQETGNFQIMEKQLALAEKKRQEKQAVAEKLSETIAEQNRKQQEQLIQSSRDTTIADLVSQGLTNPADLLKNLNFNEAGERVGNFTADEINKTLKNIAKANDTNIEKLSGDVRDFFILKENGTLPENISGLPEGSQLKAWMQFMKPVKVPGVGSVNKITLSEAKSLNLPLSVVGLSEGQLSQDFASNTPPSWFVEKAQNEAKASLLPTVLQDLWSTYKGSYNENYGKEPTQTTYEKGASTNKEKVVAYFKNSYGDQVDDSTTEAYAKRVQTYIDSGLTYAKAMEKLLTEDLGQ